MDTLSTAESFFTSDWLHSIVWFVIILAATIFCSHLVKRTLRHIFERPDNPLQASSLIINIGRGVVWIIGGSILLEKCFGVNPNALVTALGVGGVALSLGLQDTLSNLIGGIQMTVMKVVRPGDNIEVGSESGVVSDVGLRHTTITNSVGETVVIPNSVISKTALVQLPPAEQLKVSFCVTGSPDDLGETSKKLAAAAKAAAESISPVTMEPKVLFNEVSEYGFKGKIVLRIEDSARTDAAADAIVRAIAPITRA